MPETKALRMEIVQGATAPAATPAPAPPIPSEMADLSSLFGRSAELDALSGLWQRAGADGGRVAVISGEAGIGKSLLVHSLADYVTRQGGLVLVGHCYEFEQALPFQPIVEMLRSVMNQLRHAALAPAHRAALTHLVPDLLGAGDSRPAPTGDASDQLRLHLFEALLHAFQVMARRQPLLLIFEDVHWAAASTLDWLTYIVPRLDSSRILAIVTYRTHEIDAQHLLARLEQHLARAGRVSRFLLRPLSRQANRELVAHLSGLAEPQADWLADRLFTETGGNPFFLHELVRGLIETGQITVRDGQWTGTLVQIAPDAEIPLPDSLRETIAARVARLDELSRMFILTAAVAGRVFQYDIVRQAGGWREEQALAALEKLLARGFLRTDESKGHFSFFYSSPDTVRKPVPSTGKRTLFS